MPKYAQVIVDVPAKQTDRLFTYLVPPELTEIVRVGSRVTVTFAARTLLAMVVSFSEQTEVDEAKLRPISDSLDLYPSLTQDLIQLALWMSDRYVCSRIAALYAMLPKALKVRYEQRLALNTTELDRQLALTSEERAIVERLQTSAISRSTVRQLLQALPHVSSAVRSMVDRGLIELTDDVRNKHATKQELWLELQVPADVLATHKQQLRANATQQHKLIEIYLEQSQPKKWSGLSKTLGMSREQLKPLIAKGWFALKSYDVFRDPFGDRAYPRTQPLPLNREQQAAYDTILGKLQSRQFHSYLLHGITGSGKTEVYLQLIQAVMDLGLESIVLVPEISLTPQMIERFKGRFGEWVAVLHSRLSDGERYDEWRKIRQRKVKVAIGARSAVFAPFEHLGLIIIDEEHETSYKQEESPKYVTRDVAHQRCRLQEAVLILGTATPSMESYTQTISNHVSSDEGKLVLGNRAQSQPLPAVNIVDMRDEMKAGHRSIFSRKLTELIHHRLASGEQIMLLLNRRGYSTFVMCRSCGQSCTCPHCEIALTYHQKQHRLQCHYCGYLANVPAACDACGSPHIRYYGVGTQRVEEELIHLFSGARVIRMDVDTTASKHAHEQLLSSFGRHEADILLGTQMISKGLDFPNVTLVGVINADTVLNMPDFRAAEKTFQLLTQVAGRAGRADKAGEVVIQTYNPDHYSLQYAKMHDYAGFAKTELQYRQMLDYPPFCRLVLIHISHEDLGTLVGAAENLGQYLREYIERLASAGQCSVLGPAPSPMAKLKDRYRYQCLIKYKEDFLVLPMLRQIDGWMESWVRQKEVRISIDVDPYMLM